MFNRASIARKQKTDISILVGFIFLSLVLGFSGFGKILTFLFPVASFGIGFYFYKQNKLAYIRFVWWLWFLTPLIRRVSDQYSSYTEPSVLLLAPFIVTFMSFNSFFEEWSQQKLPFLLSLYAVVYGTLIAVFFQSPATLTVASLDWFVPVVFGCFIYTHWRQYLLIREIFQSTFLWGLLLMGIYGVIQFLILPEWDKSWMINADFASAGRPEPLMVNVWSTMSSNQPLSTVFMAGLLHLIVMERKGPIFLGANIFGFLTFLLAKKRTLWITFALSLIVLIGSLRLKKQARLITTVIVVMLLLVPLVSSDLLSESIIGRMESLSALDSDNSAAARQETYAELQDEALTSWIGEGLGRGSFDSAILSSLLSIGWFGSLLYFGGLLMLLTQISLLPLPSGDSFAAGSRAIVFGMIAQLPLGHPHTEVNGMILWSSIALCLSSIKYHAFHKLTASP